MSEEMKTNEEIEAVEDVSDSEACNASDNTTNSNLIECKVCKTQIAKNAKTCPKCGAKNKKEFYKRPWFIVLAIIVFLIIVTNLIPSGNSSSSSSSTTSKSTTSKSTTSTTTVKADVWRMDYYVDEFNNKTDEWYVTNNNYFKGKFSNSATTDSLLYVAVLFDADSTDFMLFEYGSHQVKNSGRYNDDYTIKIEDCNGKQSTISGAVYGNGGDRITVYNTDVLHSALKKGDVKVYIYETDRATTQYSFKIEKDNLLDLITF